jgi:hypothetical protein
VKCIKIKKEKQLMGTTYKEDKRDPRLTSLVNKEIRVKIEASEEEQKMQLI